MFGDSKHENTKNLVVRMIMMDIIDHFFFLLPFRIISRMRLIQLCFE